MRLDMVEVGGKASGTVVGQSLTVNKPHPVRRLRIQSAASGNDHIGGFVICGRSRVNPVVHVAGRAPLHESPPAAHKDFIDSGVDRCRFRRDSDLLER
jgi:hypothetical protein